MLSVHFAEQGNKVTLQDCIKYFRNLSAAQRSFYSQVCILMRLILVMPATNAVSFSAMQRLKSYLRSTMTQSRLNHLMIIHLIMLDSLDFNATGNQFIQGSEQRLQFFGKFE